MRNSDKKRCRKNSTMQKRKQHAKVTQKNNGVKKITVGTTLREGLRVITKK